MNNQTAENLISLFARQIELQKDLQRHALNLKKAITIKDLDKITVICNYSDTVAGEIESLEEERIAYLKDEDKETIRSFAALVKQFPSEKQVAIEKLRIDLKKEVKDTTTLNSTNRLLLEEASNAITRSVKILSGSMEPATGYSVQGRTEKKQPRTLLNKIG